MNKKRIVFRLLSVISIFLMWQLIAVLMKKSLILPSPVLVIRSLASMVKTSAFWTASAVTFFRVLASFIISTVTGILTGFFCGIKKEVKYFLEIPLTIIRVTPVIAFILFVIYWFSSGIIPVFVCVMMTFPVMVSSVISGFDSFDKKLLDMAVIFNFSKTDVFKYIKLPQIVPFIKNGIRQTFGLCWKVVVAGEVISLPHNAIGTMLQREQIHLETASVMALTIFIVAVSFLLEKILGIILEDRK